MQGKTKENVIDELQNSGMTTEEINELLPFKVFDGNKPTTTIFIDKLSPESLGKLIALYEHKIFVQGVLWNIYSYDQFGVELGKELAATILKDFHNSGNTSHDTSTQNLLRHYKRNVND